jgi:hypothetical protein
MLRSKVEANKVEDGPKQGYQTPSGSSGTNPRITLALTLPYRVTHPLPLDHPTANSVVSGHPALTSRSSETARETAPNFRSIDFPNRLESWDEILGWWWAPQREDMPPKFQPLAPYNSQNHESWPRTLWTRVHPKINESKAKSGVWGVKIIHKEAQGTHPLGHDRLKEIQRETPSNRWIERRMKIPRKGSENHRKKKNDGTKGFGVRLRRKISLWIS